MMIWNRPADPVAVSAALTRVCPNKTKLASSTRNMPPSNDFFQSIYFSPMSYANSKMNAANFNMQTRNDAG